MPENKCSVYQKTYFNRDWYLSGYINFTVLNLNSVKLEKNLYQLLLENETVIIPGFGAFLSDYQPSVIDFELEMVNPPAKNISFNPKIRNNDGVLVNFVAETEGISHFQALKVIEKERDRLLNKLDKGEKLKFENIGQLYLKDNHEYCFEADIRENLLLDSFGLESVSLLKDPAPETENLVEETPEPMAITGDTKEENIENAEIIETEKTSVESPETLQNPLIAPLNEPVAEPEITEVPEPVDVPETSDETIAEITKPAETTPTHVETETVEKPAETPLEKPEESKTVYYKKDELNYSYDQDNKPDRKWLWLLLVIPLALGLYFIIKPKPEVVTENSGSEIKEQPQELVATDSLKTDTAKTEATKDTLTIQKQEIQVVTPQQGTFYYLIGGSFTVEENARKYMEKLGKKGLESYDLGKKGKFYLVAIARYETEKEASSELNKRMKENPGKELWILKK